jgi:thiol-disulfide isomerase/thioredoxin
VGQLLLSIVIQVAAATSSSYEYKDAYEQAEKTGQPLVVLVGADWCPACQAMKQTVIPQLERQGTLAKVSFAMVNTDRQQALAGRLMQGGSIPQLVMYRKTAAGWQRQQLTCAQSVGSAASFLSQGTAPASVPSPANLSQNN